MTNLALPAYFTEAKLKTYLPSYSLVTTSNKLLLVVKQLVTIVTTSKN